MSELKVLKVSTEWRGVGGIREYVIPMFCFLKINRANV